MGLEKLIRTANTLEFGSRFGDHCTRIIIFWCFFDRASYYSLISFTNFNAQFLYSLTICMLHYNPRQVSSINMPIFRRTNCIITTSGIVNLYKRLYSMPDESILLCSLLSSGIKVGNEINHKHILWTRANKTYSSVRPSKTAYIIILNIQTRRSDKIIISYRLQQ